MIPFAVTSLHHKKDIAQDAEGLPALELLTGRMGSLPPVTFSAGCQLLEVFFSIAIAVSYSDGSPEICFVKCKAHPISHTWISSPYESIYRIPLNYLAFSAFLHKASLSQGNL